MNTDSVLSHVNIDTNSQDSSMAWEFLSVW